jgi:AcrR family transcriptional regulator
MATSAISAVAARAGVGVGALYRRWEELAARWNP